MINSVSVFDPSLGPDPLRGVENENTRQALIHRYLGDIPKAKEFLVKAAYEDDDDLASFLILYSVDSGGGFGFYYDEYDKNVRDKRYEIDRLLKRGFWAAHVYFDEEYKKLYMEDPVVAFRSYWYEKGMECFENEIPILCLGYLLAKNVAWVWVDVDGRLTSGPLYFKSLNWLADFGDAKAQFEKKRYFLSSEQCYQPAIRAEFQYLVSGGALRQAMNLKTIRNPLSYQGFEHVEDPLVKYKVGRLYHNRLLILTRDEITTDPRPFIKTFKRVKTNCQKAVLYWLWMTKGSIIGKDISLVIAHHLWESRLTNTDDWDFQGSDKKSWWDWGQNFVQNLYFGF